MHAKPDGTELCKNLEFMGRSGIKVFDDGLRVAFISGKDNDLYENSVSVRTKYNGL